MIQLHTGGHGSPQVEEHFECTQRLVHFCLHGGQSIEHEAVHG